MPNSSKEIATQRVSKTTNLTKTADVIDHAAKIADATKPEAQSNQSQS